MKHAVVGSLLLALCLASPAWAQADESPGARFHRAIYDGDLEAVKALLASGLSPNTPIERLKLTTTPVVLASSRGDLGIVRVLVEAGADVNAKEHSKVRNVDHTALSMASELDVEIVRYLLGKGAKVDERVEFGGTVLMAAARKGDPELIDVLLAAGANPNAEDDNGFTPLSCAVESGKESPVRTLVAKGADVNHANAGWKMTPLHHAIRAGSVDMVRLLLELKANPNARTKAGETPLTLAQKGDQEEVLALLKAAGAR
jgi:ankyrin repeat protein